MIISELFLEKSKFIFIGLTGRTGSGCTTAASILESPVPDFPRTSDIRHKNNFYYNNLDLKRYKILKSYIQSGSVWRPFYSIKISDLISAYFLRLNKREIVDFIYKHKGSNGVLKKDIQNMIKDGSFSTNFILKKYKKFQDMVLDHSLKVSLTDQEKASFLRYLKLVRKFTRDFKNELMGIERGLYVSSYQAAGNSIRKIGVIDRLWLDKKFEPEKVFHLPESINRVVKCLRKVEDKAYVVIDAIRNEYEARFFRDRYAAFYLVSINATDSDRKKYMQEVHKFDVDQFEDLEETESGKRLHDKNSIFISPNVKRCIEISDIHISNPRDEHSNNNILKSQLAWYVALMLHPGLVSPTSMERVMQIAYSAKSNSGCISRHVGAVVTNSENSIVSVGWNDVAKGQTPCALRSAKDAIMSFNEIDYSYFERNNKKFRKTLLDYLAKIDNAKEDLEGRNISYCFKDLKNHTDLLPCKDCNELMPKGNQVYTRSLHAEENAFLQIAKYGGSGVKDGKLYTTASPCELCSKKAYQLGIKEIIYIDPYPGIAQENILQTGINIPKLKQFRGAVGRGYHQLYDSTISYKDELDILINSHEVDIRESGTDHV